jgi:hypothetical protein
MPTQYTKLPSTGIAHLVTPAGRQYCPAFLAGEVNQLSFERFSGSPVSRIVIWVLDCAHAAASAIL